jgi:hypothetical protein
VLVHSHHKSLISVWLRKNEVEVLEERMLWGISVATACGGFLASLYATYLDNKLWMTVGDYFCMWRKVELFGIRLCNIGVLYYTLVGVLIQTNKHLPLSILSSLFILFSIRVFGRLYKRKDYCFVCISTFISHFVFLLHSIL